MDAASDLIPPLPAATVTQLLCQCGLLLLTAAVLGRISRRLGMAAVVGELATGIVLATTGWFDGADQVHFLDAVAQLGAVLLVGIAGAHLDVATIRRRSRAIGRIGVVSLVVPLSLGVGAGFLLPGALVAPGSDRPTFALFLGVCLAVSAVPVIAKTLADLRLLQRDIGQLILATAGIEDAAAWFLLSFVSAMATHALGAGELTLSAAKLAGFVVAAVLAGRPLILLALRLAERADGDGTVLATATAAILLGAGAANALGLEAVFGAVVCGTIIGTSPQRTRLQPLRDFTLAVLAPLFLACAGLRVDFGVLADPLVAGAGAVILALAVAGKYAGAYAGARWGGLSHWDAVGIGAGLNARGVVEIVIASVGLRLGVLTPAMYAIVVLVAVFTSMMAPPVLRAAARRSELVERERVTVTHFDWWPVRD